MMRLKFSVEDILKDNNTSLTMSKNPCYQGDLHDGKRQVTSDGESVRSESPDSTMSLNSDDAERKVSRRIRTTIQHWQKEFLETAFISQQYPTVNQYESLSKQLGLPHYVTKVWFQNRRSKSRKEGAKEQQRRKYEPYPVKEHAAMFENTADDQKSLREGEEGARLPKMNESPPFLEKMANTCNCDECVASSVNRDTNERIMPPRLVSIRDVCNCGNCISRFAANGKEGRIQDSVINVPLEARLIQQRRVNGSMEERLIEQSSAYNRGRFSQNDSRGKQRFCNCEECLNELQKLEAMMKRGGAHPHVLPGNEKADLVSARQYMQPQSDPRTIGGRNTLHYLAAPYESAKQKCNCLHCLPGIKSSRY